MMMFDIEAVDWLVVSGGEASRTLPHEVAFRRDGSPYRVEDGEPPRTLAQSGQLTALARWVLISPHGDCGLAALLGSREGHRYLTVADLHSPGSNRPLLFDLRHAHGVEAYVSVVDPDGTPQGWYPRPVGTLTDMAFSAPPFSHQLRYLSMVDAIGAQCADELIRHVPAGHDQRHSRLGRHPELVTA